MNISKIYRKIYQKNYLQNQAKKYNNSKTKYLTTQPLQIKTAIYYLKLNKKIL